MKIDIEQLRDLRRNTQEFSRSAAEDLAKYIHLLDKLTFVRKPDSQHTTKEDKSADVGVTVTCSCLMALGLSDTVAEFKKFAGEHWSPAAAFKLVVSDSDWKSSGLLRMNAFTSTLVLRTFGFLVEKEAIMPIDPKLWIHKGVQEKRDKQGNPTRAEGNKEEWTLLDVFQHFAAGGPDKLSVEKYPTSTALVYWFIDAIQRTKLVFTFESTFWTTIAEWAAREFWKQQSLVVAENDVLMDPVAMAMGACLCKKLKQLTEIDKDKSHAQYLHLLPSEAELEFSLKLLFARQASSGIWPKYFPLFHYPDAGGNFCFTFEMLEAVLNEFGKDAGRLLEIEGAFEALSKAFGWCKRNRFEFQHEGKFFRGWNSGGQLKSLTSGIPESWATAVVHMFLWELEDVLSRRIEEQLLVELKASRNQQEETALKAFADIDIRLENELRSLKSILTDHIIEPALHSARTLRRKGLSEKVSALLFGPPGTSKTELCWTVARRLGWPLVQIDPSHFLEGGLEGISAAADKIFNDLMDLTGVVILFDEMDALVQTRDDELARLDTISQLLTTSMLPKLAKLHEQKRSIFFMATNFQNRFDPAIKRAGRFDLLLCMGPPSLKSKYDDLALFMKSSTAANEVQKCAGLIKQYVQEDPDLGEMLRLFTFGEYKAFIKGIQNKEILSTFLAQGLKKFKDRATAASQFNYLRLSDLDQVITTLNRSTLDDIEAEPNMNFEYLRDKNIKLHPIVRYIADKRQSRIQA